MFHNLSIRWKMLLLVLVGPLLIAGILAWQRVNDIRRGAEEALISRSAGIVLMAEATRDRMSQKLQLGVIKPFTELDSSQIMEAVPVIMALQVASDKASEAGYTFRSPKLDPRNPANAPTELEKQVLAEMESKKLKEKIVIEKDQIRYFKPIYLTTDCLYCHGDPRGTKDVTGGIKEGWRAGEMHGAFEIVSSLTETNKAVARARWSVLAWVAGILALVFLVSWLLLQKSVIQPLSRANAFMEKVSGGDLTGTIVVEARDEIGQMSENLNRMSMQLNAVIKDIARSGATLLDSSSQLGAVSDDFSIKSEDTAGRTHSVAAAAEEMSANMASVAAATEEAATNITMVAAATEEMTSNINGIVRSTEKAQVITRNAVAEARSASEKVDELGAAAREIGKVTEAITEISAQTNLLALNATIEAARAGEAGKGFAVVANEIKVLARQTAAATGDITARVHSIQGSTEHTVQQIQQISQVIDEVNAIVMSIFTAVGQQSATTMEIAESIGQASIGIQEVTENVSQVSVIAGDVAHDIAEVNQASASISAGSGNVKSKADELRHLATQLQAMVSRFQV